MGDCVHLLTELAAQPHCGWPVRAQGFFWCADFFEGGGDGWECMMIAETFVSEATAFGRSGQRNPVKPGFFAASRQKMRPSEVVKRSPVYVNG
jgi:hypothetical protein